MMRLKAAITFTNWGRVLVFAAAILLMCKCAASADASPRRVVSLDGSWQVEQGGMEAIPKDFSHKVAVPGLIDMAQPAFSEVGVKSKQREAFWYRRTFTVEGAVSEVALLKIHKAMWGAKVFLNGQLVGEHLPSYTPAILDVKRYLKGEGQANELVIRVGAYRTILPEGMPNAWDFEKYRFIPGIYDTVELILTAAPHVVNVQTVPDVPRKAVRVVAEIQANKTGDAAVEMEVCEAVGGKTVGSPQSSNVHLTANQTAKVDLTIPMPGCRLWSPEDPFLYTVKIRTAGDTLNTRFGMRSFATDPKTGRMVLNGKPYYMRGTNVTAYRFFEDATRGDLPWRADWVRKLHQQFKSMHWNSIRYCIGFPPDFWYDIADEEGFLIQDEFPIWLGEGKPEKPEADGPDHPMAEKIIPQYIEWMRKRWNHACVVIWDAQNESWTPETGKAIQAVRGLDLSNRPWENGYEGPQSPTDCAESHPYLFIRNLWGDKPFYLRDLATTSPVPELTQQQKRFPVPVIINEYDWLWLNRDGSTTCLTGKPYEILLGKGSTVEQRRMFHARGVAALTEFWRCNRQAAGVLHFCGLGYSRPSDKPRPEGGATCDDFIDIEHLTFEPLFEQYVRDAFAPVGIMIDAWADRYPPGTREFPVVVINDLYDAWKGTIRLRLLQNGKVLSEKTIPCEVTPLGSVKLSMKIDIPADPGLYEVEAALVSPDARPVRSIREFQVP